MGNPFNFKACPTGFALPYCAARRFRPCLIEPIRLRDVGVLARRTARIARATCWRGAEAFLAKGGTNCYRGALWHVCVK